jgi:hypothetical protein
MVAAGTDHTGDSGEQPGNGLDGNPICGIIRMVIIVVQGGDGSFQEVFLATVIVFEPDKGVVVTEQLFQFVRSAASATVWI